MVDRKGHDMGCAIDPTKIQPTSWVGCLSTRFSDDIQKTIELYPPQPALVGALSGDYQNYYQRRKASGRRRHSRSEAPCFTAFRLNDKKGYGQIFRLLFRCPSVGRQGVCAYYKWNSER